MGGLNTNIMKYNPVNKLFKPGTGMSYASDPLQLGVPPVTPEAPAVPPPAPALGNSSGDLDVAAQQEQMKISRGRAATMLTGGAGLANTTPGTSAGKYLLGQ